MIDIKELIDVENGTQVRRIYSDQEIYQQELERIFARSWLFLTHESLIPNFGDYVVTKMGEDEVIVWRQRDDSIKVFLNFCTHRGMKLCMSEAGNARAFSCGYHGWAFGIEGKLESVPLEESYGPRFDRCKWGLREIAKVECYKGFIFGCADASSPTLKDYLGDAAWYFDLWADTPGGYELVGPPSRMIVDANWKAPAENFIGDTLHAPWTHAPSFKAGLGETLSHSVFTSFEPSIQATARYGHGLGILGGFFGSILLSAECPELEEIVSRRRDQLEKEKSARVANLYMGQWAATIFPNCSYLVGMNVFKTWHPIGPDKVEIMTWTLAEKNMSDDLKQRVKVATHRFFGSAGLLESDDLDNMTYGGSKSRGYLTRQGEMNLQFGMGTECEDPELPGIIGPYMSEIAQRGFYRAYTDFMSTGNWKELEATTAAWKENLLRNSEASRKFKG